MTKIVGVKHNGCNKLYWFNVPNGLSCKLNLGDKVLCNTSKGQSRGVIECLIENENEIENILKSICQNIIDLEINYFPSADIIGKLVKCNLNKIKITKAFAQTHPNPIKIAVYLKEYYDTKKLPLIEVNKHYKLKDGYISYLIAKMFGIEQVQILIK